MKKIAIASDHGGFDLKKSVIAQLLKEGWEIDDLGPSNEDSVDYPDYGIKLAETIANKKVERGIVICGTGVGMSIAANRLEGIRAGLVSSVEVTRLIRQHNDANVLVIPGRFMEVEEAINCVQTFIETQFEEGRHKQRIEKI